MIRSSRPLLSHSGKHGPERTSKDHSESLEIRCGPYHELIHAAKHGTLHEKDLITAEREARAAQRNFLFRAAKSFGVSSQDRDPLIEENKVAERVRIADYQKKL